MSDYYTEDLAEFGFREIDIVKNMFVSWSNFGLPDDFSKKGMRAAFNKNSGNVFLVNENYQVCMLDGEKLESFYFSPYEGLEGFFWELYDQFPSMHFEDQEWFAELAKDRNVDLPNI